MSPFFLLHQGEESLFLLLSQTALSIKELHEDFLVFRVFLNEIERKYKLWSNIMMCFVQIISIGYKELPILSCNRSCIQVGTIMYRLHSYVLFRFCLTFNFLQQCFSKNSLTFVVLCSCSCCQQVNSIF